MTHTNRNFFLAYVLLVALPLFGLAGVLRAGRKLSAPLSVSGVWKLSVNTDQLAANPCAKFLAGQNPSFTISQSGRRFTLSLPTAGTPASSGTVDGTTLSANLTPASSATNPACSAQPLLLTASIDNRTSPHSLQGLIHVGNCSNCKAIEFHATRDEQPKVKEAR